MIHNRHKKIMTSRKISREESPTREDVPQDVNGKCSLLKIKLFRKESNLNF